MTVGGQTLKVTHVGRPSPVSSASYDPFVTQATIVSFFGVNLELSRTLIGRGDVLITVTADRFYGSNTVQVTIK